MKKAIIYAALLFVTAVTSFSCGKCESDMEYLDNYGRILDVEVYDSLRNRVYDMACDIVFPLRDYYLEVDKEDRQYTCFYAVNEVDRNIICTYDVPDLWVLVRAIRDMDDESLADAIDCDIIVAFWDALHEYMEYAHML